MKETKERFGMLLLFDIIGLLLTTLVVSIIISKVTSGLDFNLIIVSVFFFGLKILLMGIADITGIGKKLLVGILFIVLADVLVLGINVLMAFGLSNKLLLIIAATDIVMVILARVIWKAAFSEKQSESKKEPVYDNHSDPKLFDAENENENLQWMPSEFFENSDVSNARIEVGNDTSPSTQHVVSEAPVVQVGTESLTPVSEKDETLQELLEQLDSENAVKDRSENSSADDFFAFEGAGNGERPSDAPNLNALDEFFGESIKKDEEKNEPTKHDSEIHDLSQSDKVKEDDGSLSLFSEIQDTGEDIPNQETISNKQEEDLKSLFGELPVKESDPVSPEINELTQEMNRQMEVLQSRVDDLEQREAEVKRKEEALKQASAVTVRPKEVLLDNAESEIIINEDDLALLKAYLRQHPEI